MRLIHTTTWQIHDFSRSSSSIPPYAILSHTWGDDEVNFSDMSSESYAALSRRKGFVKIRRTCDLARRDNLDYAWIDTCCIDKSSSAELTEAINSMFEWYANSAICYVFLSDYVPGKVELKTCRWWTRGWTLQELLAPENLVFYDAMGDSVGTKASFGQQISEITKIDNSILSDRTRVFECSISHRMSWAASRQTTLIEDEAYSLLGIFGIHIPLIYGEGRMAFRRLQEEIIKRDTDLTIFCFDTPNSDIAGLPFANLIAESPSAFRRVVNVDPGSLAFPEFMLTNKGISFFDTAGPMYYSEISIDANLYSFELGVDQDFKPVAILLRKIAPGIFCRKAGTPIHSFRTTMVLRSSLWRPHQFCILTHPTQFSMAHMKRSRDSALRVPRTKHFRLADVAPYYLWDATDRVILKPPYHYFHSPVTHLLMRFEGLDSLQSINLVVLAVYVRGTLLPQLEMYDGDQYPKETTELFEKYAVQPIASPSSLKRILPEMGPFGDCIEFTLSDNSRAKVQALLQDGEAVIEAGLVAYKDLVLQVSIDRSVEEYDK